MGTRITPQSDMGSNIAIFGDNVAARNHPDWLSQSPLGPAKIGNNNYNIYWNIICATQPEHRTEQLAYIEDVDRHSLGVGQTASTSPTTDIATARDAWNFGRKVV